MSNQQVNSNNLILYTIYCNPSDYPGTFVVRRFMVTQDGVNVAIAPSLVCGTLEEARDAVPFGLTRLVRDEKDDPCIVESWF